MLCSWTAPLGINHLEFLFWTGRKLMSIPTANISLLFHCAWKSREICVKQVINSVK
jgi:hypothetical protein